MRREVKENREGSGGGDRGGSWDVETKKIKQEKKKDVCVLMPLENIIIIFSI